MQYRDLSWLDMTQIFRWMSFGQAIQVEQKILKYSLMLNLLPVDMQPVLHAEVIRVNFVTGIDPYPTDMAVYLSP
jgi:hypothetical protein